MEDQKKLSDEFLRLVQILEELREKCPWDKKQTIATLRHLTIEETYELADAITEENWQDIKEELGDIMLHLIFYAKIGNEQNQFSLVEVLQGISEKLIKRHPHIYGDVVANDEETVKQNWEKLKLQQGKKSVLEGVPKSLPALVKAIRIQEKSAQVGFEWDNTEQVWAKVEEEIDELKVAIQSENKEEIEEEFGDVLFSLVNLSRFINIDAENALEKTNKKFIQRFQKMEQAAMEKQHSLAEMSLEEMDELWNEIKRQNKK